MEVTEMAEYIERDVMLQHCSREKEDDYGSAVSGD